jgi:hypothetical protein
MRIGKILAALPIMAVGMALWKHSLWVASVSTEDFGGDGTCQGLEEILCKLLSILCFALSALVLFVRPFLRSLVRSLVDLATAAYDPGEPRHREDDTGELFY